ncbi:hypothetical protein [Moorena sp. SIO4G3]|nr:hypothetical protein [Moorena sp. SIO4G3]
MYIVINLSVAQLCGSTERLESIDGVPKQLDTPRSKDAGILAWP